MATPWEEGFRASRAGKTIHENPFAPFTREHDSWQAGWQDYDEHDAAKAAALDSIGWFG